MSTWGESMQKFSSDCFYLLRKQGQHLRVRTGRSVESLKREEKG